MIHYCTCLENPTKGKRTSSKIRPVDVCREGICTNCGYYAVACHKEVKDSFELYYILRSDNLEAESTAHKKHISYKKGLGSDLY